MRPAVILSALALLSLAATWLFAGRQFVLLLDRVSTERVATLPAGPFVYSSGTLQVGDYALETSRPDGQRADLRVDVDAGGQLVLHGEGKDFPLGNRIGPPDTSGRPDIPFAPAPDDVVTFSQERSRLSWPTPFGMNFMTGQSPIWRRNLYFRLSWHKRSGAVLDMVWRYEQWFHAHDGWNSWTSQDGTTGLVHIGIVATTVADPEGVESWLARTKGWAHGEYRLESRGVSADGFCDVLRVIHRLDGAGAQPGGGRSIELYVDRATRRIDKELGLQ